MNKNSLFFLLIINLFFFIVYNIDYSLFFLQFNISYIFLERLLCQSTRYGSTIFHPIPITCLILLFSFLIAPILSVGEGVYLFNAPKDIDWNYYLFILSLLYTLGIILFYLGAKYNLVAIKKNNMEFFLFSYNKRKFITISLIFLIFSFVSQIFIFNKFGGVLGYLNSWTEDREQFDGLGIWYMIAEPFPVLLLIMLLILIGRDRILRNKYKWVIFLFILFFISKLIFGGFRGSRSNTIWGLFWFAGIVHLYLFKLKKIHYILGAIFIFSFMSLYSIYKTYGVDSFSGNYSIEDTNRYSESPITEIYLGDFSRATINSYQLSQLYNTDYQYKYGQTYLYAVTMLFPGLNKLYNGYNKNSAGYEIVTGSKVYPGGDYHNSRVFGIYGEGLLNFNPLFSLFLFGFFGVVVAKLDNISRIYFSDNVFIFIIPFLGNLSFVALVSDSDNVIFFAFKNGFLIIVYLLVLHYFVFRKVKM